MSYLTTVRNSSDNTNKYFLYDTFFHLLYIPTFLFRGYELNSYMLANNAH